VPADQRSSVGGERGDRNLRAFTKRARSAAARYRWLLLGTAGLIGLVLGLVGLDRHYGARADFGDLVYYDLKLLRFGGAPSPPPGLAWELQVARFLLPLVVLSGALVGLLALFRDRFQQARLPFVRGHVLVAGLGDKGLAFVQAMRAEGARVVAIDSDAANPNIAGARTAGATVLVGDATDDTILAVAGVRRARYLLVTADDTTNVGVALQAERLLRERRGASRLDCLAHVLDPDLCHLLKLQALRGAHSGGFRVDFFNFYQQAARIACDRTLKSEGRIVLVGDSPLVEQIALRVGAERSLGSPTDPRDVTIVHPDANALVATLNARHPDLTHACTTSALQVELDGLLLRDAQAISPRGGPALVYVCATDDAVGVEIALALNGDARATGSSIVVCASRSDGLASVLDGAGDGWRLEGITVLSLARETCTSDVVKQGMFEILGRAIHDDYVTARRREDSFDPDDPALAPWDELLPAFQDSDRAQAQDMVVKLRAIGCDLIPFHPTEPPDCPFTDAEVERLSEMEHDRWVKERTDAGWRFGPTRDPQARKSPYLIPWAELSEEIQERDRETIYGLPKLVARAGFRIERLIPAAEPRSSAAMRTTHARRRSARSAI